MNAGSSGIPGVRRSRASLDAIARLGIGDAEIETTVHDVSMSGVRLGWAAQAPLAIGQVLQLAIEVHGRIVPALPAHVVRIADDDLALAFGPMGAEAERQLGTVIERFGELQDGTGD